MTSLLITALATLAIWEVLRILAPLPSPLLLAVAAALCLWDPYNWSPLVAVAGAAMVLASLGRREQAAGVQALRLNRRTPDLP